MNYGDKTWSTCKRNWYTQNTWDQCWQHSFFTNIQFVKSSIDSNVSGFSLSWLVMNKWLQDFAYRINLEWWMFALAGMVAFVIAIVTLGFQAVKAAVVSPVKSLRTE